MKDHDIVGGTSPTVLSQSTLDVQTYHEAMRVHVTVSHNHHYTALLMEREELMEYDKNLPLPVFEALKSVARTMLQFNVVGATLVYGSTPPVDNITYILTLEKNA